MEMICASACITSMVCFSLEVKYGNMLDTKLHMHRHRVGARGNATTFPLPWEGILGELQKLDGTVDGPDVPRTGAELQYVVQVLLKTNDEDRRDGCMDHAWANMVQNTQNNGKTTAFKTFRVLNSFPSNS